MLASLSVWHIALFLIIFLLETAWVETEHNILAGFWLIGCIVTWCWIQHTGIAWIWHSPGAVILAVLVYMAAGGVWSLIRWWKHVADWRRGYELHMNSFLAGSIASGIGEHTDPQFKPLNYSGSPLSEWPAPLRDQWLRTFNAAPQASRSGDKLTAWVLYWPWSLFWTMVSDPVVRIARAIGRSLRQAYQRVTDHYTSDIEAAKKL